MADLWRLLTRWYISSLLLAGVGVLIGYAIFFHLLPGQPKIGYIDVPFTVIDADSAWFIGQMLDFVEREDSIKAVVISLDSPGGFVAESEKLFLKTAKLREKKPVVIVSQGVNASGGYLWSIGANYIYAMPSSIVGSVGVLGGLPRPRQLNEDLISTGPAKLGGTRRTSAGQLETLKESFLNIVFSQRGDKLKLTPLELSRAQVYLGMEALRLGLVDAIGTDSDGVKKAASLAGISSYDVVDVNVEVLRNIAQKIARIQEPLNVAVNEGSGVDSQFRIPDLMTQLKAVRDVLPTLGGNDGDVGLPIRPEDLDIPRLFYLYVPPAE